MSSTMTEAKQKNLSTLPLSVHSEGKAIRQQRRWRIACCCGSMVAIVILIVLVLVILGVTVFKPRNPNVTVNSVKLDGFYFNLVPLEVNVSLDVNLSVKNPNKASFKFGNSTTELYYRGTNVGEALIPAGKVEADKTVKMNSTVYFDVDRLISNTTVDNLLTDAQSGVFKLSTWTRLSGRVNVLNIFKHHAVCSYSCEISIFVWNGTIQNDQCRQSLKL